MRTKTKSKKAKQESGFVVVSSVGEFWTGEKWSKKEEARMYAEPPDPFADAAKVVKALRLAGHTCSVGYLFIRDIRPSAQIDTEVLQLPEYNTLRVGS